MSSTQRMELALLFEDRSWDTETFDIPISNKQTPDEAALAFFWNDMSKKEQYRKVVQVALYNDRPEE